MVCDGLVDFFLAGWDVRILLCIWVLLFGKEFQGVWGLGEGEGEGSVYLLSWSMVQEAMSSSFIASLARKICQRI